MRRFGQVIGLREDRAEDYKALHRGVGVRDLLTAANIQNFSIFLQRFPDGKLYEFAYFEYAGSDYEGDMAHLAEEPRNAEWLKLCDPMQLPLPGSTGWTEIEQIYFNA